MKEFSYVIKDEIGIHARPAGMLVKVAKQYSSKITLESGGKQADATKLMAIMSMGVKTGATVVVRAEGDDEADAIAGLETFMNENL